MKKLTAIILALMLMLTLTVTAAAESDGLDPAQRYIYQLVTEHDPEPVFRGNFTYWRWKQTIENPADNVDREIWLGFYGPTERLSGGTIDVLTRTDDLLFYAQYPLYDSDYVQLLVTDNTGLPDTYLRQIAETHGECLTRGDPTNWITADIFTTAYQENDDLRYASVDSNIEGVRQSEMYQRLRYEIPYLLDVLQINLAPAYTMRNFRFYSLSNFCRFHQWGEPQISLEPTPFHDGVAMLTCERCHFSKFIFIPKVPFADVQEDDYFAPAVDWAVEHEITAGTSETTFGPSEVCTREQIVTMLWASAGKPETEVEIPFADVPENAWYAEAVAWAYENGVTSGVAECWFGVKQPCTRAQIVTMLWRLNGSPVEETPLWFSDVGGWCENAVRWAARRGITAGTGGGAFSPDAECTRAQAVTFLWKGGEE